jgi:hypothetical protein
VGFGRPDTQGVYVGTLDGGEPMRVLVAETAAVYAPGWFSQWNATVIRIEGDNP